MYNLAIITLLKLHQKSYYYSYFFNGPEKIVQRCFINHVKVLGLQGVAEDFHRRQSCGILGIVATNWSLD